MSSPSHASPDPDGQRTATRVLCISHSAVSRTHGRRRYEPLLDRPDLDVELITPDRWFERGRWLRPDPPGPEERWVHPTPIRWARGGAASWHLHHYVGLDRHFRRFRPQVIHLWQEPWSLVTWQVLRLRNRLCPEVPIVLEVDQNLLKVLPMPFEQIRATVLRQTSFVLGRSDQALGVVEACGYAGPCGRIGYGVDRSVFKPGDRAAARSALGLDGFTVGYVGRMIEEKGLDDLLDAVAQAKTAVTLAIMGEGPHRAPLAARAAALGLSDRLVWLPWGEPREVAQLMQGLDVLALLTRTTPSVQEQFGRVIIESQACGTPVIGSSCGAIPQVVGDGGWIVPEASPPAVARLLERLAGQPGERAAARRHGLGQVTGRFSFEAVAAVLSATWLSVQAAGRARRFPLRGDGTPAATDRSTLAQSRQREAGERRSCGAFMGAPQTGRKPGWAMNGSSS